MDHSANTEVFEKMSVPQAVRTMAVPAIIGQLIILFYNMADTFFVGRTNNPYMVAGASLILPVFNIAISLAGLTGTGGGALISRLLGIKNYDEAKKVYSFSIYFSLAIAAAFSLGTLLFMDPLMHALGAGEMTYDYARIYAICVIVLGGIPTVMTNVLSNLIRSIGESKKAGFGVTMGGIINIFLDPLFMFVLMPKGMEIMGAGIATFLSNCISCLYFVMVLKALGRKGSVLRLANPAAIPEAASIRSIFAVGIPSSISVLLFDLDYIVLDKLMTGYGDVALAAVGIVLKVERLPLNIGVGICQGMMPIVAYNYAAKNWQRMRDTKNYAMKVGIISAIISIALYLVFAGGIMRIFISDVQTVILGTGFLRVRSLATLWMFLCFFHVFLFNGFGEGKQALFLGVVRWAVLNIPMLFILNNLIGMYGLVWGQVTADILTVIISLIVYRRYERTHLLMSAENQEKI